MFISTGITRSTIQARPARQGAVAASGRGHARTTQRGALAALMTAACGLSGVVALSTAPPAAALPSVFATLAAAPGVTALSGDFNGDGRDDLALTGGAGWTTVPVALSRSDGTFSVTTTPLPSFPGWAQQANVKAVAGDFDGDGHDDIALTGAAGWNTVPIASSRGDGSFTVMNQQVYSIPIWAQQPNVKVVTGDFNADGRDDLALTGGAGWNTVPIAYSRGAGTFAVTNPTVPLLPIYTQLYNAKAVSGDFDGDGRDDLAVTGGPGWTSIPVAFTRGGGHFTTTTVAIPDLPGWAFTPNAKPVTGDFNADGRDDLALIGGTGWTTVPIGYSLGTGNFLVSNSPVADIPLLSQQANVRPLTGDFNGDGRDDVALTGGAGWSTVPIASSTWNGPVVNSFDVTHRPIG